MIWLKKIKFKSINIFMWSFTLAFASNSSMELPETDRSDNTQKLTIYYNSLIDNQHGFKNKKISKSKLSCGPSVISCKDVNQSINALYPIKESKQEECNDVKKEFTKEDKQEIELTPLPKSKHCRFDESLNNFITDSDSVFPEVRLSAYDQFIKIASELMVKQDVDQTQKYLTADSLYTLALDETKFTDNPNLYEQYYKIANLGYLGAMISHSENVVVRLEMLTCVQEKIKDYLALCQDSYELMKHIINGLALQEKIDQAIIDLTPHE